nr:hypothetical protein [Tanacetum cinerariifolium]
MYNLADITNPKQKVTSLEILVLRLSKQEENPEVKAKVNVKRKMILPKEDDRKKKLKGKSKKDVSDFELETDVLGYSSDEADRKRKKLKINVGLKRKRSGSDSSHSSKIDTKSIKLLISKLEKKVKKQESDEDSVLKKFKKKLSKKVEKEVFDEESLPKKGKKKEKQLTPKEAAHEEYISSFPSFHARTTPSSLFSTIKNSRVDVLIFLMDIGFSSLHNVSIDHLPSKLGWFSMSKFKSYVLIFDSGDKIEVTPSKIHDMLGVPFRGFSLFDLDEREIDHEFVRKWAGQFYPLELKKVCVNDIAQKLIAAQEIDFLSKWLREDFVISDIDRCGYIYDCLRDSKLLGGTNHYLGLLTFLIDEWNEAEVQESKGFIGFLETSEKEDLIKKAKEKLSLICAERVIPEDYMRKASLKCPCDGKFVALHEKYVNLFKDPISFEDDGNRDNVGVDDDENKDDYENGDDDGGNVNNDANDYDGNRDEEDVNEGDKDLNGSNSSFGFSKISLEYFGNDSGPAEKDKAVEGNPTKQGTVIEGNEAEEGEIMSTPENFTQWLEKNVDLVREKKLFARNLKQYAHIRHTQVAKVKHAIPKLKWKTNENFHDCRISTMLHMETFDGGSALNLDCGLPVES